MRIQNNITAMNTHRMYTINNNAVSKSAEKLSSGYRINRAGDDAAGLAISEKMRSQIRGLNMASKNSQDAVSLIQTAEGALQEVHSMLQRMNELANQAATGTNEEFDRQQIDAEFNQLKEEIDQIAETTSFNNMKLLDGSLASDAANVKVADASYLANGKTLGATGFTITGHTGLTNQVGDYKIAVDADNANAVKVTFTDAKTGNETNTIIDLTKAAKDIGNGKSFSLDLSAAGLGTYTVTADGSATATAAGLATALAGGAANLAVTTTATAASTKTYTSGTATGTVATATAALGADGTWSNVGTDAEIGAALTASGANVADGALQLNVMIADDGTATLETADGQVVATAASLVAGNSAAAQTLDFGAFGTLSFTATDGAQTIAALKPELETASTSVANVVGTETAAAKSTNKGALKIQVGANQGEQLEISVAKMSTTGLNISNSSISDQDKAGSAITATQNAINLVSEQRATLGAMQNRLEHKIANLDNTSENLSAAESRIRDVDIAKEMTNFTKNNILSQAATAMLAQANAAPQGVLSLLQ